VTGCLLQVASTSADFQPDERDPEVELVLTENDYTLKMWPHKFKAVRGMRQTAAASMLCLLLDMLFSKGHTPRSAAAKPLVVVI
jgi:hypothetical protein